MRFGAEFGTFWGFHAEREERATDRRQGGGIDVPQKGVVFCDFGLVFANKRDSCETIGGWGPGERRNTFSTKATIPRENSAGQAD
jgi:hypothetical protein